jgi:triosephosphate isomerase
MAGNWKMYKTPAQTTQFFERFIPLVAGVTGRDIVIFPPYVDLAAAVAAVAGSKIGVGAQNLFWMKEGAYTGEISAPMIQATGAEWVLIGHSERRQYFGETDETVLKRTIAALEHGLKPVVCVGERLEEREAGNTEKVLLAQFQGGLAGLKPEQFAQVVIAYEPVWAIGTGKTATPEIAEEAHRVIRAEIARKFGAEQASRTRILYGGSVKPENTQALMAQEDIDGVLVGGASLDPASFAAIVNY